MKELIWVDWLIGIEISIIAGLVAGMLWRLAHAPYWLGVYIAVTTAMILAILYCVCVVKRR